MIPKASSEGALSAISGWRFQVVVAGTKENCICAPGALWWSVGQVLGAEMSTRP